MKKINFKDKQLKIDWISINVKGLTDLNVLYKLSEYLF